MTFLAPLFLAAAGAALLPLVLHLLARRRTVRMPFSTIRFLQLAQKRSSTKVRMENFLLWLLRTLLMLLLAFAFARPVARLTGYTGFGSLLGTSRRDVVIVWDGSCSMSYEMNGRSVWDASKDLVVSIIRGLSKGDRVSVFLAADTVVPVVGEPTSDLDFAATAVKAQQYHYTPCSLSDATMAALDAVKDSPGEREVFIVTDGQASAWDGFRPVGGAGPVQAAPSTTSTSTASTLSAWDPQHVDKNIPFFVSLLGARNPVNTSPIAVQVQPPLLMTDTAPELLVTIAHTGPAQQNSIALSVDEREIVSRSVDLQENAGYNLMFNLPPMSAGVHALRVRSADDPLMADNDFLLLLKVRDTLPVLVAGSEDDAFFIDHALAPSDKAPVKVKRIDASLLASESLDSYPCIFLVNALPLPGPAIASLQDYVRRGGVVTIFPGDRGTPDDYNAFSFLPAKVLGVADNSMPERDLMVLLDPLDPLFQGLKMPPGVSPSAAVERRLVFDKLNPGAKDLAGASSDRPLLLGRTYGAGRVLLFSVSADRQWSDLPLSPFFLPLIQQTVHLACGLGADRTEAEPSSSFILSEVIGDVPDGATLIGPDHAVLPIRKVQKEGAEGETSLVVDHLDTPGYYFLARNGPAAPEPVLAVNVDRSESDLKPIAAGDVPAVMGLKNVMVSTTPDELQQQIQEHRVGHPLNEVALWAVLILSALELYLANRACRKRATLSQSLTVNASGRVASTKAVPAEAAA
ncbi:MAG: BatA domain-containing protein [Chthoniobacteraceae bacterium]|jgi:hypothetical protein